MQQHTKVHSNETQHVEMGRELMENELAVVFGGAGTGPTRVSPTSPTGNLGPITGSDGPGNAGLLGALLGLQNNQSGNNQTTGGSNALPFLGSLGGLTNLAEGLFGGSGGL